MLAVDCGEIDYEEALRTQRLLVAAREADAIDDVVLGLSHPPVYTAGRRADIDAHVLRTPATRHIPLVQTDRGGDVTYHGPGQIVVYPVVKLPHAKAVRPYVAALERAVVSVVAPLGIEARGATIDGFGRSGGRRRPRTGVWVGDEKLAAIGIRVTGRTTSHGLALNVDPDMDHFAGIVPCGIRDGRVCSLASLGVPAAERDTGVLVRRLVQELAIALDRPLHWASKGAAIAPSVAQAGVAQAGVA